MNHDESAFSRAVRDTKSAMRSRRWGAVSLMVTVAVEAIMFGVAIDELSWFEKLGMASALVLSGPAVLGLVGFTWAMFQAPYRQREEARAVVAVRSAMGEIDLTAHPGKYS